MPKAKQKTSYDIQSDLLVEKHLSQYSSAQIEFAKKLTRDTHCLQFGLKAMDKVKFYEPTPKEVKGYAIKMFVSMCENIDIENQRTLLSACRHCASNNWDEAKCIVEIEEVAVKKLTDWAYNFESVFVAITQLADPLPNCLSSGQASKLREWLVSDITGHISDICVAVTNRPFPRKLKVYSAKKARMIDEWLLSFPNYPRE
jgi:hypothetical protein